MALGKSLILCTSVSCLSSRCCGPQGAGPVSGSHGEGRGNRGAAWPWYPQTDQSSPLQVLAISIIPRAPHLLMAFPGIHARHPFENEISVQLRMITPGGTVTTESSSPAGAVGSDGSARSALLSPVRPCRGLPRTFSWDPPVLASQITCFDEQTGRSQESETVRRPSPHFRWHYLCSGTVTATAAPGCPTKDIPRARAKCPSQVHRQRA